MFHFCLIFLSFTLFINRCSKDENGKNKSEENVITHEEISSSINLPSKGQAKILLNLSDAEPCSEEIDGYLIYSLTEKSFYYCEAKNNTWTVIELRGPQGEQGLTGPQGTAGPQGPTGPQGTDAPLPVQVVSTIAPGDYATLTHAFTNPSFSAHFIQNNRIYDIADYFELNSIEKSAPVEVYNQEIHESKIKMEKLSSGEIALVYIDELDTNQSIYLKKITTAGVAIGSPVQLITSVNNIHKLAIAPLSGGGFAVAHQDSVDHKIYHEIFDNTGVSVAGPTEITSVTFTDASILRAVSMGANYAILTRDPTANSLLVHRFNSSGVALDLEPITIAQDNAIDLGGTAGIFMKGSANGGLAILHTKNISGVDSGAISFVEANGETGLSSIPLSRIQLSMSQFMCSADNGNALVGFELNSINLYGWAMVNIDTGQLIKEPQMIEPINNNRGIGCGTFGNGDFMAFLSNNPGKGGRAINITNDGDRIPGIQYLYQGGGYESNATYEMVTISDYEVGILFQEDTAPAPFLFQVLTKGNLSLEQISPTEVRLYNNSKNSVQVVLEAKGTN